MTRPLLSLLCAVTLVYAPSALAKHKKNGADKEPGGKKTLAEIATWTEKEMTRLAGSPVRVTLDKASCSKKTDLVDMTPEKIDRDVMQKLVSYFGQVMKNDPDLVRGQLGRLLKAIDYQCPDPKKPLEYGFRYDGAKGGLVLYGQAHQNRWVDAMFTYNAEGKQPSIYLLKQKERITKHAIPEFKKTFQALCQYPIDVQVDFDSFITGGDQTSWTPPHSRGNAYPDYTAEEIQLIGANHRIEMLTRVEKELFKEYQLAYGQNITSSNLDEVKNEYYDYAERDNVEAAQSYNGLLWKLGPYCSTPDHRAALKQNLKGIKLVMSPREPASSDESSYADGVLSYILRSKNTGDFMFELERALKPRGVTLESDPNWSNSPKYWQKT
jgi:hypothetical protein